MNCFKCSKKAIIFGFGQVLGENRTRFMGLCLTCARTASTLSLKEDPIQPWNIGDGNRHIQPKAPYDSY
jgi:protein-arginine kinase activator protein McsA